MASSQIEVANMALTKLGANRISSLTEDSTAASEVNARWNSLRDSELAAHPWTFALKRAEIPSLSSAPTYGWTKAYPKPSDCLRIVQVGEYWALYAPAEDGAYFELEGSNILCDETSPLRLRYVYSVTNVGLWAPLFCEAFASKLAYELCEKITQSSAKKRDAMDDYRLAISTARRTNAIEQPPQRPADDSWSLALRGY